MRPALGTGIAAAVAAGATGPAGADMAVYYHAGGWDAFSGPGDNGKPVCGIGSTNPADNRSFSLRFQIGGENVTFQAKKPTWRMPAGTLFPVVVQIGLNTPFSMMGAGNGQMVEWSVDSKAMQTFDAQFRARRFDDRDLSRWVTSRPGPSRSMVRPRSATHSGAASRTGRNGRQTGAPRRAGPGRDAAPQRASGAAGRARRSRARSAPYAPSVGPAAPR